MASVDGAILQVVGVICEHEGKILLCKRGIEPCKGLWTIPAGKSSHHNDNHIALKS